ncbi:DUF397 domain-containing protein [Actinomadura sp. HBU206391]|uniref:DUF397 domain-containing protein n=1 Tax=Actinomadura sp. HBU206391 TaxID=2731692 RepID=UPI00164F7712|nr:DUF397 domain-containing protein [Actinomadura sp. HBU206391]MBC6459944.1 DUF397 domain-containing protein [Actinomadura sp. HBU206391]
MTEWRKSSRSGSLENSDCVEVADLNGAIGIRDSKAPGIGHLRISAESFADLLDRVKRDRFDIAAVIIIE